MQSAVGECFYTYIVGADPWHAGLDILWCQIHYGISARKEHEEQLLPGGRGGGGESL